MPVPSKEAIAAEMRAVFGADEKRIAHAVSVLSFAERILAEESGDSGIVVAAALLHDIGIQEAERKYNSNAGRYQEIEGPPIVRKILEKLAANEQFISEVCDIIGRHHSPRKEETLNYKILYDADMIVNLRDEMTPARQASLKEKLPRLFFSPTALDIAIKTLLSE
jgi:HD superfamily phosphodiesterase